MPLLSHSASSASVSEIVDSHVVYGERDSDLKKESKMQVRDHKNIAVIPDICNVLSYFKKSVYSIFQSFNTCSYPSHSTGKLKGYVL
jgi:hypothetical protein